MFDQYIATTLSKKVRPRIEATIDASCRYLVRLAMSWLHNNIAIFFLLQISNAPPSLPIQAMIPSFCLKCLHICRHLCRVKLGPSLKPHKEVLNPIETVSRAVAELLAGMLAALCRHPGAATSHGDDLVFLSLELAVSMSSSFPPFYLLKR